MPRTRENKAEQPLHTAMPNLSHSHHLRAFTRAVSPLIARGELTHPLRANGKAASLFMYPCEGHSPLTKETALDQWAHWTAWLDLYVKHAGEMPAKKAAAVPATTVVT